MAPLCRGYVLMSLWSYDRVCARLCSAFTNRDHRKWGRTTDHGRDWAKSEAPNSDILVEMIMNPDLRSWVRRKGVLHAELVFIEHYCEGAQPASKAVAMRVVREVLIEEVMDT